MYVIYIFVVCTKFILKIHIFMVHDTKLVGLKGFCIHLVPLLSFGRVSSCVVGLSKPYLQLMFMDTN